MSKKEAISAYDGHLRKHQTAAYQAITAGLVAPEIPETAAQSIPLYRQGDMDMYQPRQLAMRSFLYRQPAVEELIGKFWRLVKDYRPRPPKRKKGEPPVPSNVPSDPQANTIGFDQYKALYVRLWKAFDPTRKLLESDVEQEWAKDSGNLDTSIANQLSKDQFTVALFEIFDVWTEGTKELEYRTLMAHSLYHISQMGPSGRMLLPLNKIQGSVFAMMRRKSDGAIRGATFTQSTFNDQRIHTRLINFPPLTPPAVDTAPVVPTSRTSQSRGSYRPKSREPSSPTIVPSSTDEMFALTDPSVKSAFYEGDEEDILRSARNSPVASPTVLGSPSVSSVASTPKRPAPMGMFLFGLARMTSQLKRAAERVRQRRAAQSPEPLLEGNEEEEEVDWEEVRDLIEHEDRRKLNDEDWQEAVRSITGSMSGTVSEFGSMSPTNAAAPGASPASMHRSLGDRRDVALPRLTVSQRSKRSTTPSSQYKTPIRSNSKRLIKSKSMSTSKSKSRSPSPRAAQPASPPTATSPASPASSPSPPSPQPIAGAAALFKHSPEEALRQRFTGIGKWGHEFGAALDPKHSRETFGRATKVKDDVLQALAAAQGPSTKGSKREKQLSPATSPRTEAAVPVLPFLSASDVPGLSLDADSLPRPDSPHSFVKETERLRAQPLPDTPTPRSIKFLDPATTLETERSALQRLTHLDGSVQQATQSSGHGPWGEVDLVGTAKAPKESSKNEGPRKSRKSKRNVSQPKAQTSPLKEWEPPQFPVASEEAKVSSASEEGKEPQSAQAPVTHNTVAEPAAPRAGRKTKGQRHTSQAVSENNPGGQASSGPQPSGHSRKALALAVVDTEHILKEGEGDAGAWQGAIGNGGSLPSSHRSSGRLLTGKTAASSGRRQRASSSRSRPSTSRPSTHRQDSKRSVAPTDSEFLSPHKVAEDRWVVNLPPSEPKQTLMVKLPNLSNTLPARPNTIDPSSSRAQAAQRMAATAAGAGRAAAAPLEKAPPAYYPADLFGDEESEKTEDNESPRVPVRIDFSLTGSTQRLTASQSMPSVSLHGGASNQVPEPLDQPKLRVKEQKQQELPDLRHKFWSAAFTKQQPPSPTRRRPRRRRKA